MKKGIFISIEGPDGSGKSTQIENIKKYFSDKNIDIFFTREPGGTKIGERIRDILLDNNCTEMCDMTEAMLFAASRAQHVSEVIKPNILKGNIVVCDRFVDSSLAYQGYARGLGEPVTVINKYAVDNYMPDLTILLKLEPEEGLKRMVKRGKLDRLDSEKASLHEKVFKGYLDLLDKYPDRIYGIDASKSIDEIKEEIYRKLDELLEKHEF